MIHVKIKEYIDSHHLKQVSIARSAGFSAPTFNAMLKGKRKIYADDLEKICGALEVSAETFISNRKAG